MPGPLGNGPGTIPSRTADKVRLGCLLSARAVRLASLSAADVCLYKDPHNALDRHDRFARTTNIVGHESMHFMNIAMAPMKEIAVASILANESLGFAVNMTFDCFEQEPRELPAWYPGACGIRFPEGE